MENKLRFWKPGKVENSYYGERSGKTSRFGLQSDLNDGAYIYEWSEELSRHVRVWAPNFKKKE